MLQGDTMNLGVEIIKHQMFFNTESTLTRTGKNPPKH